MRHLIQNGVIQVSSLAKIEAHANTSPIKRPTPELSLSVAGRDRRLTAIERRRLSKETELSNGRLLRREQRILVVEDQEGNRQIRCDLRGNAEYELVGRRRAGTRRNKTAP